MNNQSEGLTTQQVLNMISMIVEKHKCKILEIDWEKCYLDFDGPTFEAQTACAEELEHVLNRYFVDNG